MRVLVAYRGDNLAGLLPLVEDRRRYLFPLPLLRAAEIVGPLSTPLLDPESPERAWSAMLGRIGADGMRGLLLPHLGVGALAEKALDVALRARGCDAVQISTHQRAVLTSDVSGADYVRATLDQRRRKEVDRQRRRLAEYGKLGLHVARTPSEIGAALDDFLDLEASGWKGRRGTDMKHADGTGAFMREATRGLSEQNAIRIISLVSGRRTVACGIVLISGMRAYYFKTAYDETFARHSPGLLLTLDLTRLLLDDPAIVDADSLAIEGHTMIDPIWIGRQPIQALFVSLRAGKDRVFRTMIVCEKLREKLRAATAPLRARLRNPGKIKRQA